MATFHSEIPGEQKDALKRAQEAAGRADGIGMLQGLCDSMVFEGYERYFRRRYPHISVDDIHDFIGKATDELYTRVSKGEKILSIQGYLWKVVDRMLCSFARERKLLVGGANVDRVAMNDPIVNEAAQETKEERRDLAISIAESLLPRLGLVNVQSVMRYIFGAIKNGAQDVPCTEIAEALDMSPENVRQSMKRGFDRLARIVREENLIDDSYEFPFLDEMQYYIDESAQEGEESDDRIDENN